MIGCPCPAVTLGEVLTSVNTLLFFYCVAYEATTLAGGAPLKLGAGGPANGSLAWAQRSHFGMHMHPPEARGIMRGMPPIS